MCKVEDGIDVHVGYFNMVTTLLLTFVMYTTEVSETRFVKIEFGKLKDPLMPDELRINGPVGPLGMLTESNWFVPLFASNPFNPPPQSFQSVNPLGPSSMNPGFPITVAVGTLARLFPKSSRVIEGGLL